MRHFDIGQARDGGHRVGPGGDSAPCLPVSRTRAYKNFAAKKVVAFLATPRRRKGNVAAQKRRWKLRYPERRAAQRKARKLAEMNRVPTWAKTHGQRRAIAAIYARAALLTASTGVRHEVDHVYPLRGKTVSGLHVAENLRVVSAAVNNAKGAMDPAAWMLS